MKQKLVGALRKLRLLPLVDRARFVIVWMQNRRSNRDFVTRHPGFVPPPAFLSYDAYGHVNYRAYADDGREPADYLARAAKTHLGSARALTVCEWGCGPARILRHLPPMLPPGSRVFGTDYNARTIQWCSTHVAQVTFRLNRLAPPLPFSTGEIDYLYAISVLTHLSEEMHYAWIEECKRVVRPGGLILVTVHGDRSIGGLSADERALYDGGGLLVRGRVAEGSRTYVAYQSPRFMREVLLRDLEILSHNPPEAPRLARAQDVYLVRR
jgi:SAM-dependent methyltransferase